MTNKITIGGGFFLPCLTIIFVIGKVFHFIDWNWFWIFSPLLLPIVGFLVALFLALVVVTIGMGLASLLDKIRGFK
jgi:hypothetical protein